MVAAWPQNYLPAKKLSKNRHERINTHMWKLSNGSEQNLRLEIISFQREDWVFTGGQRDLLIASECGERYGSEEGHRNALCRCCTHRCCESPQMVTDGQNMLERARTSTWLQPFLLLSFMVIYVLTCSLTHIIFTSSQDWNKGSESETHTLKHLHIEPSVKSLRLLSAHQSPFLDHALWAYPGPVLTCVPIPGAELNAGIYDSIFPWLS